MDDFTKAVGETFVWHELYSPDVSGSKSFYTQLFGWGTSEMETPGGTYTMWKKGETSIGGCMSLQAPEMEGVPPHWTIYIAVDNVDAKIDKAVSMGGSLMVPAMDLPGIGRMALLSDPHGATFWVYTPAG